MLPCRAEARVDRDFAGELDRECTVCGDKLPAVFFAQSMRRCRTCQSDYDRRRQPMRPQHEPLAAKECGRCNKLLLVSDFGLQPEHPTGLHFWCKLCARKSNRASRARIAKVPLPATALPPTRICSSCRKRQPRTEFYEAKAAWDGLYGECKACNHDRNRKRYAAQNQDRPPAHAVPPEQQSVGGDSAGKGLSDRNGSADSPGRQQLQGGPAAASRLPPS